MRTLKNYYLLSELRIILTIPIIAMSLGIPHPLRGDSSFAAALKNGIRANEGFIRCRNFVNGWLRYADPESGLIPRNLGLDGQNNGKDFWNAQDAAADNYPFMVLTAALIDRPLFEGRMRDMLRTERKLTSRIGAMPDTYSFSKKGFLNETPNLDGIIFGSAEYVKDGLIPLTEWLGKSPWCDRMLEILDAIWEHAPVTTQYGTIISTNVEVNGEMLQTLSRIYWMTGDKKYLSWAIRLGDYYLLGDNHPTRNFTQLKLRDHGCEIISGLCELYATVHYAGLEKKLRYQVPIHEMINRILKVGRNEHGLFYNWINPQTGEHSDALCDTWGYTYNGIYTVYLIDKTESYRQAVQTVLGNLNQYYKDHIWGAQSVLADEFADSIEGAINLFNRETIPSTAEWIDSEILDMWSVQKPDGIIEGWHGDGNFARTTIMYCLWKTQGISIEPWREDVIFGAVREGNMLTIGIKAELEWKGIIRFDTQRHKTIMNLPIDWPRINQFPEWFTVQTGKQYIIHNHSNNMREKYPGSQMQKGIPIDLKPSIEYQITIE